MARTETSAPDFDLPAIARALGPGAFERGRDYAAGHRVLRSAWHAETYTLAGSVTGKGGLYEVEALFDPDDRGGVVFDQGGCTCPVGIDCKHVAALVIAAAHGRPTTPAPAAPPSWEQPLRALIDAAPSAVGEPLAFELELLPVGKHGGEPRLVARLMRPGARGGWINGSLAWNALEDWQLRIGDLRPDHLALARELYATHQARQGRSTYFQYGNEKALDIGAFESPQLWTLLEAAARLGIVLLSGRRNPTELPRTPTGTVVLDMTRAEDGDGSRLVARLRLGDEPAAHLEPVRFIGAGGHGLVCRDDEVVRLVRLSRPVPRQLQLMLLGGDALPVPAADLPRFGEELWPALRTLATVVSSDGSFTPPEISAPRLVLGATHRPGHALDVAWEWSYRVGEEDRRTPLDAAPSGPGFRDLGAERELLAEVDLSGSGLRDFGLLSPAGRPTGSGTRQLHGLSSMRFSTEVLPALEQRAELRVEVSGEIPDYRDLGESVEIAVATGERAGQRDWFDLDVTISADGRELPFAPVFTALARGEEVMLLEDGGHFSLQTPALQSLLGLIEEARGLAEAPDGPLRISRYQAGLWEELAALGVVREQAAAWKRQVGGLLGLERFGEQAVPAGLRAELRPYQREGFGWLASLWELELGGILADDMGLGKTLQVLAMICHARERDPGLGPFLVVAPTSVVSNWVTEAARFAPGLRVAALGDTFARARTTIGEATAGIDVLVTTYTLFRLEAEAYATVAWAGLLLDEAQFVKNHQAKTYKCVRELDTPFKLAITGTPMENNLMELWALLSITAPGLFPDPKRFAEQYARPIERGEDAERLARLRRRIRPLVLRRTKELVAADLPAKQEQVLEVELHPRHRKLYDTRLQRERQKILGLLGDFDRNRFTILRSITLLRQLSLHPGLVDEQHAGVPSAKLTALVEHLEEVVEGGHRALVFSQFTSFLSTVRARLEEEGIEYCYLDGRTRKRGDVVQRFKAGTAPVFLISLKAGGSGLNLTEADYCFLLDPWWNPATEAQAVDRTHRIGQTRPVMVYRLVSRGTIEEKVVALAQRKAELFRGVLDDGEMFAAKVTAEDIRGLLG